MDSQAAIVIPATVGEESRVDGVSDLLDAKVASIPVARDEGLGFCVGIELNYSSRVRECLSAGVS